MSIFKKKIDFGQFIADAIFNSVSFYDSNSEKMILMADEFKVLDKRDNEELKEFGYALIIADLMISGLVHFSEKVTNEKIGEVVGFLYVKFLKEVNHLNEDEIKRKTDKFEKLLTVIETKKEKADNTEEDSKLLLCSTFAELYSGGNLKDKKVEGKRFAAFKLAKGIVKADLIKTMLKEFKINLWT